MKDELNKALKGKRNLTEVDIFREMAHQFSKIVSCSYVEEIHGNKGKVEFDSTYFGAKKKVELGDLLLITYHKAKRELRLCVIQAKYRRGRFLSFLNFPVDIFQWELLSEKKDIKDFSCFKFPKNILNFRRDYKSITAYVVFYQDNICEEIDLLYTIPCDGYMKPVNFIKAPCSKGNKQFAFRCPRKMGSPNLLCTGTASKKEIYDICSMDVFAEQVRECKIGAPIESCSGIENWILNLLSKIVTRVEDSAAIKEILRDYHFQYETSNQVYFFEGKTPSVMVIVTGSDN